LVAKQRMRALEVWRAHHTTNPTSDATDPQ
jgi:hypothetical protein